MSPLASGAGAFYAPVAPQDRSLRWPAETSPRSLRWLSTVTAPPRSDAVYYRVCCQLKRYLRDPRKPLIIVVAEAAESDLLQRAIAAYGNSSPLRAAADLVLVVDAPAAPQEAVSSRESANSQKSAAPPGEPSCEELGSELAAGRKSLLLAIDRYDLYGNAALFSPRERDEELVELLRVARDRRGVLVIAENAGADGWSGDATSASLALELLSTDLGVPVVPAASAEADELPEDLVDRCGPVLVDPELWAELSRETQQLAVDRRWQLSSNGYAAFGRRLLESRRRRGARPSGGRYPTLAAMLPKTESSISVVGLRVAEVVGTAAAAAG